MTFLGTGQARDSAKENQITMRFFLLLFFFLKKSKTKRQFNIPLFSEQAKSWGVHTHKQPHLNGLGLWAMPFSFPAHFCPSAKRERQHGEVKQEKRSWSHTLARTENTWKWHECCLRLSRGCGLMEPSHELQIISQQINISREYSSDKKRQREISWRGPETVLTHWPGAQI